MTALLTTPLEKYCGGAMWVHKRRLIRASVIVVGSRTNDDGDPDLALVLEDRAGGAICVSNERGQVLFWPEELQAWLDAEWRHVGMRDS